MGEDAHRMRPEPESTSRRTIESRARKKPSRAAVSVYPLGFTPRIPGPQRIRTVHHHCPFPICRIYATTEPISPSESLPSKEGIFFLPLLMTFSRFESLCP
jgi:hypothetical protein